MIIFESSKGTINQFELALHSLFGNPFYVCLNNFQQYLNKNKTLLFYSKQNQFTMKKYIILITIAILIAIGCKNQKISLPAIENIESNSKGVGPEFDIQFQRGQYHNHPTFAFWLEDLEGNYIETLFVTQYLAEGVYGHGSLGEGKWDNKSGEAKRPATLPYWLHKRGIKADGKTYLPTKDRPVADALTGATPQNDFHLTTRATGPLPQKFRLMMEINQPWDWNEYWNNNKFPDDADYKSSCQPALVYAVDIDLSDIDKDYFLNPIGHSHYSGKDGELYTDLTTITTAKEIAHRIKVHVVK